MPDGLVAPVEPQVEPISERAERWPQRDGHGDHTEGRAHGEHGLLGCRDADHPRRPVAADDRVGDERPDHDQVVQDRGEHRGREAAMCLQEPDRDGADAVEHDLRHEPTEEEDPELHLRPPRIGCVGRDQVQTDDLLGEQRPQRRDHDQDHEDERHHPVGHVAGVLPSPRLHPVDEDRHEDRGEDPSQDQLVDDVGCEVGDRVDRARASSPSRRGSAVIAVRRRNPVSRDRAVPTVMTAVCRISDRRESSGRGSSSGAHGFRRRNNLLDQSPTRTRPAPIVMISAIGLTAVELTSAARPASGSRRSARSRRRRSGSARPPSARPGR